jgi:hypothetical protein
MFGDWSCTANQDKTKWTVLPHFRTELQAAERTPCPKTGVGLENCLTGAHDIFLKIYSIVLDSINTAQE